MMGMRPLSPIVFASLALLIVGLGFIAGIGMHEAYNKAITPTPRTPPACILPCSIHTDGGSIIIKSRE